MPQQPNEMRHLRREITRPAAQISYRPNGV
jgi:hypothetical protein